MCASWIIGVFSDGIFIIQSQSSSILDFLIPVKPTTFNPIFFASLIDLIIFFDFPEVEIAI